MYTAKDFEHLEYHELVDLLGKLTKDYTSDLASDPTRGIEDERIYVLNLLMKEIEIREGMILDNDDNLSLSI